MNQDRNHPGSRECGADSYVSMSNGSELEEDLYKFYEVLDGAVDIEAPDLAWFESITARTRARARNRFIRDLTLFWMVSLLLVGGVLFAFNKQPMIYAVISAMSLLAVPVVLRRRPHVTEEASD